MMQKSANLPVLPLIFHLFKDGLSTELQAKMARGCRFMLFWYHNYQVTKHPEGWSKSLYGGWFTILKDN